jgi:glycosyltransferase involved in cell wall biosynthesis
MPDISVIIAVRNEERYIKEAIQSVCTQTGVNHEVIVIDDNSTDKTFEILEVLKAEHGNLYIQRNPNPGKVRAFNLGISLAKGKYYCLFAGDDIMPQGSLLARLESIKAHPQDGLIIGLSKLMTLSDDKNFNGQIIPKQEGRGGFTGTSYLMTMNAVKIIFPVPEILPNEDSWLYLCINYLPGMELVHSDIISNHWRVHAGNSISHFSDFETYNKKYTPRMEVYKVFYRFHEAELSERNKNTLIQIIKCEEARREGNVLKIMLNSAPLIERLRAVSAATPFFYNLRKRFFHFFSGWG